MFAVNVRLIDTGVNLSCAEAAVAKNTAEAFQVPAANDPIMSEGVPQQVQVDAALDPCHFGSTADDGAQARYLHFILVAVKCTRVFICPTAPVSEDGGLGLLPDVYNTLFLVFPKQPGCALFQVYV
ncbi:MAG: hypothetical protein RBT47_09440, partial [Anaerolineae bacterium]|nr:hypothetical protein [Anaerolineae bacterium]